MTLSAELSGPVRDNASTLATKIPTPNCAKLGL